MYAVACASPGILNLVSSSCVSLAAPQVFLFLASYAQPRIVEVACYGRVLRTLHMLCKQRSVTDALPCVAALRHVFSRVCIGCELPSHVVQATASAAAVSYVCLRIFVVCALPETERDGRAALRAAAIPRVLAHLC